MESRLEPGDRYEEFVILRELGVGTFARVYAAIAPGFDEPIALKLSRGMLQDEAMALRALREIRILESLTNPHVVRIHSHGVGSDDRWYMVMERLHGHDMLAAHDFIEPADPARATRWAYEACVGLDEAHAQGIVHRDIKPENLWILPDDRLKVIDFGLARGWDPTSTMGITATVGHMLVGTPHYSQPEQVEGSELTPASDVYSVGIVLYELLSSKMPLFAKEPVNEVRERLLDEPMAWLTAHVKRPVIELGRYRDCRKRLPKRLMDVVHSMLRKRPVERPRDGGEVARKLARILATDFRQPVAATLRMIDADGERSSIVITPGVHEIGTARSCLIRTASDGTRRVLARLKWAGPGNEAVLEPIDEPFADCTIEVNGHRFDGPVRLVPGTRMAVDAVRMLLEYPGGSPSRGAT